MIIDLWVITSNADLTYSQVTHSQVTLNKYAAEIQYITFAPFKKTRITEDTDWSFNAEKICTF